MESELVFGWRMSYRFRKFTFVADTVFAYDPHLVSKTASAAKPNYDNVPPDATVYFLWRPPYFALSICRGGLVGKGFKLLLVNSK